MDPEVERKMIQDHYDKYEALVAELGLNRLLPLVPVSRERIVTALEAGDRHLNSITLATWDRAVGYGQNFRTPNRSCDDCPIRDREKNKDWRPQVFRPTTLSVSERVSLLKHVASYYVAGRVFDVQKEMQNTY